jgi:hypothetical protein
MDVHIRIKTSDSLICDNIVFNSFLGRRTTHHRPPRVNHIFAFDIIRECSWSFVKAPGCHFRSL